MKTKYTAQEAYAAKMKEKNCVRVTVWVHKTKAARFKQHARRNCTA